MITFQNDGLIDMRAITTFGVSSKVGDNPIGYFGTGAKYAVAGILRLGGHVRIWRGLEPHVFTVREETIRNDRFDVVHMDGQPIGFTTDVGKNWKAWQFFRELYCNVLDENGIVSAEQLPPAEGKTTIHVELPEFDDLYVRRHQIVLEGTPAAHSGVLEIHEGRTEGFYYRGILAGSLEKTATFTYNILKSVVLTEDRTVKHPWELNVAVRQTVLSCQDSAFLDRWLSCEKGTFEHQLDLGDERPGRTFLEAAARAYRTVGRPCNLAIAGILQRFGNVQMDVESVEMTDVEKAQLERARFVCRLLGHDIDRYPVIAVSTLGPGVLGTVRAGHILLSRRAFEMGTKMLAGTLLEEFLHIEYQYRDESRDFQNYLIDRIVTLAEQLMGVPL